jgi:hypothetical protein
MFRTVLETMGQEKATWWRETFEAFKESLSLGAWRFEKSFSSFEEGLYKEVSEKGYTRKEEIQQVMGALLFEYFLNNQPHRIFSLAVCVVSQLGEATVEEVVLALQDRLLSPPPSLEKVVRASLERGALRPDSFDRLRGLGGLTCQGGSYRLFNKWWGMTQFWEPKPEGPLRELKFDTVVGRVVESEDEIKLEYDPVDSQGESLGTTVTVVGSRSKQEAIKKGLLRVSGTQCHVCVEEVPEGNLQMVSILEGEGEIPEDVGTWFAQRPVSVSQIMRVLSIGAFSSGEYPQILVCPNCMKLGPDGVEEAYSQRWLKEMDQELSTVLLSND